MTDQEIIRRLKQASKIDSKLEEEKKEEQIGKLLFKQVPAKTRGSFSAFIWSQIGFMDKKVLLGQGLWILFFLYMMWSGNVIHIANETLYVLSMAPPILLLLTVEEIAKIYNKSMIEIEYATKYSIRRLVLVRLLLLSLVNGVLLLCGLVFVKRQIQLELIEILVYGLTPLTIMTLMSLKLMEKWKGEQLKYMSITLYAILSFIVLLGGNEYINIYTQEAFCLWVITLLFGIAATIYQANRLVRHLDKFEILMS